VHWAACLKPPGSFGKLMRAQLLRNNIATLRIRHRTVMDASDTYLKVRAQERSWLRKSCQRGTSAGAFMPRHKTKNPRLIPKRG
jgi:hypothetical protein